MQVLVKWMESDSVFDSLGILIAVTGIIAFGTLLAYLGGFIA
jgi:hypothetical protein